VAEKTPIGKAVKALKEVPVYLFLNGWGDGPSFLRPGSQIWLDVTDGEMVDYLSGPRPPGPYGEPRTGGMFRVSFLSYFEEL